MGFGLVSGDADVCANEVFDVDVKILGKAAKRVF